ncbi:Alpha/Beta hydrolase protein [Xylariales sp. PMI_506]|nr:Alpha/Beta hydrolase protein [Xylariales sp. PMI_506]
MRTTPVSLVAAVVATITAAAAVTAPTVYDPSLNVTYLGLDRNGIEAFLNIPYGQDTSGANRFKPPRRAVPELGSTIIAQDYGPACPQQLIVANFPLQMTDVSSVSEDCLHLNIARPRNLCSSAKLPVMVFIHGGGFFGGQASELVMRPDGLILEGIDNGTPVIHVAMNYRLGFFGFAQSDALESEGSENAGLRDQRLAIEWVRDNIANFGGDPERITIFGQSSGGLSVGLQIMAYGGSEPLPFQQGICESQAMEPGITANYTIDAMQAMVDAVGCNTTALHSLETISCLRELDGDTLLDASLATYHDDIGYNMGDIWLPTVDGDFLPAAPSKLMSEGRFGNITTMLGWCNDDLQYFTDPTISTVNDTYNFISSYLAGLSAQAIDALLALYPSTDYHDNDDASLSSEFFRTAQVFRDIIMVCEPLNYGAYLAAAGNDVYLYNWNQSILNIGLSAVYNLTGLGVTHTSEFAYVFGNLSHYDFADYPFAPTDADWALERRAARSWATFASTGKPSGTQEDSDTFQGFGTAFRGNETHVFVVGGANEGLSAIDGLEATEAMASQRIRERCAYLNSPEIIAQLYY